MLFFFFFANSYISINDKSGSQSNSPHNLSLLICVFFTESNPRHHIHAAAEEFRGADGQLSRDSG